MLSKFLSAFFLLLFFISCTDTSPNLEKWKQEIIDTEQRFNDMARDKGIEAAFLHFAADDAVLMRNNKLIKGKTAIAARFKNQTTGNNETSLTWKPDFVDVAASGDLAHTYGQYTFTSMDSSGTKTESKGVFHTVWKRQADGNWKYVWD